MGQRDPMAAARWAIAGVTELLEHGGGETVTITRATAETLVHAARLAKLPDDVSVLMTRVLTSEDSARYWERRYRETALQLSNLTGTAEGVPDSTRFT
jgi:hypothetical protein